MDATSLASRAKAVNDAAARLSRQAGEAARRLRERAAARRVSPLGVSGSTSVRQRSSGRRPASSSQRARPRAAGTARRSRAAREPRGEPEAQAARQALERARRERRRERRPDDRLGREQRGDERHLGARRGRQLAQPLEVDRLALEHAPEVEPLHEREHEAVLEAACSASCSSRSSAEGRTAAGGVPGGGATRAPSRRAETAPAPRSRCGAARGPRPSADRGTPRRGRPGPAPRSRPRAAPRRRRPSGRGRAGPCPTWVGPTRRRTPSRRPTTPFSGSARMPRAASSEAPARPSSHWASVRARIRRRSPRARRRSGLAQASCSRSRRREQQPLRALLAGGLLEEREDEPGLGRRGRERPVTSPRSRLVAFDSTIGRA